MSVASQRPSSGPAALPPSGSAGGVLTGSYPAPGLADGVVTTAKIVDGTISTGDLADAIVTAAKLAAGAAIANLLDGSVTRAKLSDAAKGFEVVTSLPTTGNYAGRQVYLRWPSSDTRFLCVYDTTQADGYGWTVFGGGPIVSQADADFGIAPGVTAWQTGLGPSFSSLLPGAYWAEWGCMMYWNQAAPEQRSLMSIDAIGAGATDANALHGSPSGGFALDSRSKGRLVTISGSTVTSMYRSTGIATSFVQRWVALHPRRLGTA